MFTYKEHLTNLKRLNIDSYHELVDKEVFYIKPSYGKHKVVSFNEDTEIYILEISGAKFESNPFKIQLIKDNE